MQEPKNPIASPTTVCEFLALPDAELERADLVAMNLTVAKGVGELASLDIAKYVAVVDSWTAEFARRLPAHERTFHRHSEY